MPVLRMPADNSLGETLGNLGQSLANNFNPLKQMQAYELQRRMWMQDEQLRQEQRKNAATQAAIGQYAHIVPSEFMPEIANMIYQNAPADQILRRVALRSGRLIDATDDESLRKNIEFMRQIDPNYSYSKDGPPVGGAATAKAFDDWKVNEAGRAAGATALGTKTGEQAAADAAFAGAIDDTTPEATANNIRIIEKVTGKPWDQPYPPPITPKTVKAADDWKVANAGALKKSEAEGTNLGDNATKPRDLSKPTLMPPAGGFKTDGADVSVPGPTSTAAPVPVTRSTPAGTIVGQSPAEATAAAGVDKQARDMLQEAVDSGVSARKLKIITARLNTLADVAANSGAGQITGWGAQQLANLGLHFTTKQEVLAEMKSLFNAQIPELRKEMGVKFEAGPELSAQAKMVGTSDLPPAVVKAITARQDALADLALQRRDLAQRTLGQNPENPLTLPDYYKEENKVYEQLPQHTQELLKIYGANAVPQPPVQSTTPPPAPGPLDALGNVFRSLFGGGQQPAPQPTPEQPNPRAVYRGPDQPLEIMPPQ